MSRVWAIQANLIPVSEILKTLLATNLFIIHSHTLLQNCYALRYYHYTDQKNILLIL